MGPPALCLGGSTQHQRHRSRDDHGGDRSLRRQGVEVQDGRQGAGADRDQAAVLHTQLLGVAYSEA
eukprot:2090-Eustigmatos_ZCMA.PRE.1